MNSNIIQKLPEKWCIFRNNEHFEEIGRWFNKINNDDSYTNSIIKSSYPYLNNSGIKGNCLSTTLINGYIEITFEQFKKYVLKEEIVEKKVIKPLPQFKIIETIETITKVENNEGNQFFIGDVVISSNGTIQTIESFDYNKAKTNIIAFTNKQSRLGNGIGIDKIEHYIEPKVEETLLEKAKRLYPIGTKFKSVISKRIFTIKNHIQEPCQNPNTIVFGTNEINADNKFCACVHSYICEWAEIIE